MKLVDKWLRGGNDAVGIPIALCMDGQQPKQYTLIGSDGKPYQSSTPGKLGGYRKMKIYGRLDCPSALRAIAKGQYVKYRVFFANEETAIAAGYRPCGTCMRDEYKRWKDSQSIKLGHDATDS